MYLFLSFQLSYSSGLFHWHWSNLAIFSVSGNSLGPDSIYRCYLISIGNLIVEIWRSYGRLISTMGFPILIKRYLYIESSSNGNILRVNGSCAGNSPVTGVFPSQRPVTRSFNVFFDLRLNKRLSKQSWGWWFETPSRPSWRHCNETNLVAGRRIRVHRSLLN